MRNKVVVVILTSIIVLGVGAIIALFALGRLGWVNPGSKVVDAYTAVCDGNMVNEYNDAMVYTQRGESTELSLDEGVLASLPGTIKNLASYQNDPTCQTILFWIAVHDEDYDAAKAAYEAVKSLHGKRLFADSNITGNQSLSSYEGAVYSLSPEARESEGRGDS